MGRVWTSLKCQHYFQASLRLGCSHSREIAEAAAPGSGIVASTILALGLAWSNVEAPEAQASFELPYVVRRLNVWIFSLPGREPGHYGALLTAWTANSFLQTSYEPTGHSLLEQE